MENFLCKKFGLVLSGIGFSQCWYLRFPHCCGLRVSWLQSLIIACLLAFVLDPAVGFLTQRTRFSRAVSANIVFFLGLGTLGSLPAIMLPRLLNEVALFFSDLQDILSRIQDYIPQPIVVLGWELHFETILPDLNKILSENITAIPESAFYLIETTTKNLIWGLLILVATA